MIATMTSVQQHKLILIAGLKESADKSIPKLISLNWLTDNEQWDKTKSKLELKNKWFNDYGSLEFINENSLSSLSPIEDLLLTSIQQLSEYFNGDRQKFDLQLDLSCGTEFQQSVWRALQQIPYGKTISYAQLAQNIGNPKAYRAVANANGKNPFSIIIPCHRVIASDGGLGGYTGGLDKKVCLLGIEGIHANIL